MIDVSCEKLIRLEDVRDYIPSGRRGKKLSKAVMYRWALKGVTGILLETVKVGGSRFTTVEAIERFISAQNGGPSLPENTLPASPTQRKRAAERAGNQLAKYGI